MVSRDRSVHPVNGSANRAGTADRSRCLCVDLMLTLFTFVSEGQYSASYVNYFDSPWWRR